MTLDFQWFALALANATRNRRRSLLTLAVVAGGTAAMLLGGGFALYTYESLAQASARDSGHLVLAGPGYFDAADAQSLAHGLRQSGELTRRLLATPGVRRVLPRLRFSGLISNGERSEIFVGSGVDARQEFLVKGPFMTLVAGELLERAPGAKGLPVVLGKGLARILGARPGAGLTLLSNTSAGGLNALDVVVAGVVGTGIDEVDQRLVLADLSTAQALLLTDKVSKLSVYLDDIEATDAVGATLARALGGAVALRSWLEQAPFYVSVRGLYNRLFGFMGAIVLVIVIFSVTNTLAMSVLERTREIGALRAMGTTPAEVMTLFTLEGLTLGAAGALLGMALAGAIAVALSLLDLQMPPPPGRTVGYPLAVAFSPSLCLGVAALVAPLSALASWLVSRRAARQPVVEALAHV